ncbi:MAG: hypothetical protein AAF675_11860 [Pseudomonadota bacterium]
MTVTQCTDAQLVLEDRPWLFSSILAVMSSMILYFALFEPKDASLWVRALMLAFAGLSLWVLWAKVPFQRFVFDRKAARITRIRWHLWQRREDGMDLDRVVAVRQERNRSAESNAPMHRLLLDYMTADGTVETTPLSEVFTARRHDKALETLNEWLTRPDPRPDPRPDS